MPPAEVAPASDGGLTGVYTNGSKDTITGEYINKVILPRPKSWSSAN